MTPKGLRRTAAAVTPAITWGSIAIFCASPLVATMTVAYLIIHEYAHYFTARAVHASEVWLPFFIPFFVIALGRTYVDDDDPRKHRKIAIAGPIAGIITAVIAFIAGWWLDAAVLISAGVVFGLAEVYHVAFGPDGKKFRRAGNEIRAKKYYAPQEQAVAAQRAKRVAASRVTSVNDQTTAVAL